MIDIGHPAHVHYFRNFVKIMESKGHKFLISARDKEITHALLNDYNIKFVTRGSGRSSLFGKLIYILEADLKLFNLLRKFKPDLCLSFGSAYAAHASKLLGVPHIAFDDTEHAKYEQLMYVPFTGCILSPETFRKNFGKRHIKFAATMDMAYLHPKYYRPDTEYLEKLQLKDKRYFLLRFVDWIASHDSGQFGFSVEGKSKIIKLLAKNGEVIISAECELPDEFIKYLFKDYPHQMHTLLQFATLFVGESGSMATEAAILGTPSVMVNSSAEHFGVFEYLRNYGNLHFFNDENEAIEKIEHLLSAANLREISIQNAQEYIKQTINLTDFMVWFVENYPDSFKTMKEDPDYQYNFK